MKRHKTHALLCLVFLIFLGTKGFSQQQNISLQNSFQIKFEKALIADSNFQHIGFQPILQSRVKSDPPENLKFNKLDEKSRLSRKLFHEHLILYDSGDISMSLDPLFNFEFAEDRGESARDVNHYVNMRGFLFRLNLGKKISVESTFRENQSIMPTYLHLRTRKTRSAYGQGRVKAFNKDGFDYAMASSVLSYSPSQRFNIQAGHGKLFVGYGHRSLLLSDLSFNYPYLKLNSTWFNERLQYQNTYSIYQNLVRLQTNAESEGLLERKQAATHYLDYAIHQNVNIGIFESVIFPSLDTSGNVSIPVNYWVPIMFVNSIVEKDKNTNNSLVGINYNVKLFKSLQIYGQLASYGLSSEKPSIQIGSKYYFKQQPIRLQVEYNSIAKNKLPTLFTHYNESLTVPYGQNTDELYASIVFHKKRWLTKIEGNRIMDNQYKTEVNYVDFQQSFIINQASNLAIKGGIRYRLEVLTKTEMEFIYFGLSTNLQNLYFNY
ncbi:MAG: hypothetical protein KDB74_00895 [Flavobacteriales bacterium]|nr:hypothetical protein [Flavobacteriales bacterium]